MPITVKSTGGGSVTLTAPNTASDLTLTMPSISGTIYATTGGVIPVSEGGTGSSTLTANNVLLGNGTSALQVVAPGTNGNVLTSNGTTWTSATPAATVTNMQSQLFTSSSSWTAPTGVTKVRLTVIGGGGGAGTDGSCGGAEGGGGGFGYGIYTVSPGTTYTVTIGSGGAGANSGPGNGTAGGTSSFGALLSATGGGGGIANTSSGASGSAASGNFRNTNVADMSFPSPWGGASYVSGNTSQPGIAWSISSKLAPGSRGGVFTSNVKGNGGYSGIVFVEWVG
jgi:hypothetical protein